MRARRFLPLVLEDVVGDSLGGLSAPGDLGHLHLLRGQRVDDRSSVVLVLAHPQGPVRQDERRQVACGRRGRDEAGKEDLTILRYEIDNTPGLEGGADGHVRVRMVHWGARRGLCVGHESHASAGRGICTAAWHKTCKPTVGGRTRRATRCALDVRSCWLAIARFHHFMCPCLSRVVSGVAAYRVSRARGGSHCYDCYDCYDSRSACPTVTTHVRRATVLPRASCPSTLPRSVDRYLVRTNAGTHASGSAGESGSPPALCGGTVRPCVPGVADRVSA